MVPNNFLPRQPSNCSPRLPLIHNPYGPPNFWFLLPILNSINVAITRLFHLCADQNMTYNSSLAAKFLYILTLTTCKYKKVLATK